MGPIDSKKTYVPGSRIIGDLLDLNMVLIPLAVSPRGRWGNMFHTFLFGPRALFNPNTANAARMYHRATTAPAPIGLLPHAFHRWKHTRSEHHIFYGHSHTAPTPKEYALQKLGLVITNALALHLRDAKRGSLKLAPPPGFSTSQIDSSPQMDSTDNFSDSVSVEPLPVNMYNSISVSSP